MWFMGCLLSQVNLGSRDIECALLARVGDFWHWHNALCCVLMVYFMSILCFHSWCLLCLTCQQRVCLNCTMHCSDSCQCQFEVSLCTVFNLDAKNLIITHFSLVFLCLLQHYSSSIHQISFDVDFSFCWFNVEVGWFSLEQNIWLKI